jgi:hypothetical protein
MQRAEVAIRSIRSEVIPAGNLNELLEEHDSKADVLFEVTARHLGRLADSWPEREMTIHLDRQGARKRYHGPLQKALPGTWVWIDEEGEHSSRYRVERPGTTIAVDFTVGCEALHLPVALASMVSKYLREALLVLLNRYWAFQLPGLAPTAGYAADGRRFFSEIEECLEDLGIDQDLILRRR